MARSAVRTVDVTGSVQGTRQFSPEAIMLSVKAADDPWTTRPATGECSVIVFQRPTVLIDLPAWFELDAGKARHGLNTDSYTALTVSAGPHRLVAGVVNMPRTSDAEFTCGDGAIFVMEVLAWGGIREHVSVREGNVADAKKTLSGRTRILTD